MFKIRSIDIFILHCAICLQLLLLFIPEVASMNTFLNDQMNIFCCKRLKCYFYAHKIFTFYVYLLPVTNKRFIIMIHFKEYYPNLFPFQRLPASNLMLKPRPMNFYIKVNGVPNFRVRKSS